jgi:uncharacterized protein (TIGR02186 family)
MVPRTTGADLVASLSNHLVAITTGFAGTDVLLFGTSGGEGDVVVVISGPDTRQPVRRKGRRMGIWLNDREVVFDGVPGFYALATNRPLEEFLPNRVAARHQIGLDFLSFRPRDRIQAAEAAEFRQALIRNKQRLQLYPQAPSPISFLGGTLFRTDMYIPANAPVGAYNVAVYLVQDGDIAHAEVTPLIVSRVGLEARIFEFAHRWPIAYGLLAIVIAGMAGWLANLAFREGRTSGV